MKDKTYKILFRREKKKNKTTFRLIYFVCSKFIHYNEQLWKKKKIVTWNW